MLDTLVLPALGLLIFVFLIYVGFAWVAPKRNRALTIADMENEDDDEAPPSSY